MIIMSGFLIKSPPPGMMKGWKKRFCVLIKSTLEFGEAKLEYYGDSKDVGKAEPKGVVLLGSCLKVGPGVGSSGSPSDVPSPASNTVRLALTGRTMELQASSPQDYTKWMKHLAETVTAEQHLSRRIRAGTLSRENPNSKKSDKFIKLWAVLNPSSLTFFTSEETTGTAKGVHSTIMMKAVQNVAVIPSSAYFDLVTDEDTFRMQAKGAKDGAGWIADIKEAFLAITNVSLSESTIETDVFDGATPLAKQSSATGSIKKEKKKSGGSQKLKKKQGEPKKALVIGAPIGFVDTFGVDATTRPNDSANISVAKVAAAANDPFSKFKSGKGNMTLTLSRCN